MSVHVYFCPFYACDKFLCCLMSNGGLYQNTVSYKTIHIILSDSGAANTESMYVVVTDELKLWCTYSLCNILQMIVRHEPVH